MPIPDVRYARSGDVAIAYQVVGDGPIDLVFIMGWVSHLEYFWAEPSFARFLHRLATFSRLILFDKRGTGLSDPAARPAADARAAHGRRPGGDGRGRVGARSVVRLVGGRSHERPLCSDVPGADARARSSTTPSREAALRGRLSVGADRGGAARRLARDRRTQWGRDGPRRRRLRNAPTRRRPAARGSRLARASARAPAVAVALNAHEQPRSTSATCCRDSGADARALPRATRLRRERRARRARRIARLDPGRAARRAARRRASDLRGAIDDAEVARRDRGVPHRHSPAYPKATASSRPCCSPTSSARRSGRQSWVTGPGASCSLAITRSCAVS